MGMFTLKQVAVASENCPKIKDVMVKNVVTIAESDTIANALYKMEQKHILRLPVVAENNRSAGIITKADIRAKQAEFAELGAELPGACQVAKIAKNAVTIKEHKNVADAYNALNDNNVSSLVVTNEDCQVVGIITNMDICNLQAEKKAEEIENMDEEVNLLIKKALDSIFGK